LGKQFRAFFAIKTDPADLHVGGGDGQKPGTAKDGERSSSVGAECGACHYKGQTHPHRAFFWQSKFSFPLEIHVASDT
jgi:hypothetical protein